METANFSKENLHFFYSGVIRIAKEVNLNKVPIDDQTYFNIKNEEIGHKSLNKPFSEKLDINCIDDDFLFAIVDTIYRNLTLDRLYGFLSPQIKHLSREPEWDGVSRIVFRLKSTCNRNFYCGYTYESDSLGLYPIDITITDFRGIMYGTEERFNLDLDANSLSIKDLLIVLILCQFTDFNKLNRFCGILVDEYYPASNNLNN